MERIQFFRSGEEAVKFCQKVRGTKYSKPSARRLKLSRYYHYAVAAGLTEAEIIHNNHVVIWEEAAEEVEG